MRTKPIALLVFSTVNGTNSLESTVGMTAVGTGPVFKLEFLEINHFLPAVCLVTLANVRSSTFSMLMHRMTSWDHHSNKTKLDAIENTGNKSHFIFHRIIEQLKLSN